MAGFGNAGSPTNAITTRKDETALIATLARRSGQLHILG